MRIFSRLFNKDHNRKECLRCLGKGHVDWDDIKRLDQELKWIPGKCAYCNGTGNVDSGIERNVPVDASYLVVNMDDAERKRILDGDSDANERGKQYADAVNTFINQIAYLYFEGGLTPLQISNFFLIGKDDSKNYKKEQQDMIDYVQRVIEKRSKK
jgi:hypothetical protein